MDDDEELDNRHFLREEDYNCKVWTNEGQDCYVITVFKVATLEDAEAAATRWFKKNHPDEVIFRIDAITANDLTD